MKRSIKTLSIVTGFVVLAALTLILAAPPGSVLGSGGFELAWSITGGASGTASGGGFDLRGNSGRLMPGALSGGGYTLTTFLGAEAVVPDVVGLTRDDAATAITGASLTVGTQSEQYHSTVPAGRIISQEPSAGASVLPGRTVNLDVSKGPYTGTLPRTVNSLNLFLIACLAAVIIGVLIILWKRRGRLSGL